MLTTQENLMDTAVDSKVSRRKPNTNAMLTSKKEKKPGVFKTHKTVMKVEVITPELLASWATPDFQRPIMENPKLHMVKDGIRENGGIIPGTLTIGVYNGRNYRVDGQHRMRAFELSGLSEGLADVKYIYFDSEEDMAEEFDRQNSPIARMKPDDHLRAIEKSSEALQYLRKECPFICYGPVKRGGKSAVSMSGVLRAWSGGSSETPIACGTPAQTIGKRLPLDEAKEIAQFLKVCYDAWGAHQNYGKLWTNMNLTICVWLYHHTVMDSKETYELTPEAFRQALMSLTDEKYIEFITNKAMTEFNRGPCYVEMTSRIRPRLQASVNRRIRLPLPVWAMTEKQLENYRKGVVAGG